MESTTQLMLRPFILCSLVLIAFAFASCSKDDNDNAPQQSIVVADSSEVTGRLLVTVSNVNGDPVANATVNLYLTYDDVLRGISLYSFPSTNSGQVDFGYILQGNYYVTGTSSNGVLKDTSVAQVLPRRSLTRRLILR